MKIPKEIKKIFNSEIEYHKKAVKICLKHKDYIACQIHEEVLYRVKLILSYIKEK